MSRSEEIEIKVKRRKPKKASGKAGRIIFRIALSVITLLLLIVAGLYATLYVVFKGPSPSTRDMAVATMLEASATKWIPRLYFSEDEIKEMIRSNGVQEVDDVTDPSLVEIKLPDPGDDPTADDEWADAEDGILIKNEKSDYYRGYVMLIRDPSRVFVGVSSNFRSGAPGLKIFEAIEKYNAVAAINAGGFPDTGGMGKGDVPLGLTISEGELLWGSEYQSFKGVIGFTEDNVLVVGNMTGKQALEKGVRDCVCFGPLLIVNGEPMTISGDAGSRNPRTAIGQRADGTVIFVVVDGRMASSLGASYYDLINIMLKYGAVNAANLDGGSSAHMYYKGEPLNVSSSLYGPRRMPTFFMVR